MSEYISETSSALLEVLTRINYIFMAKISVNSSRRYSLQISEEGETINKEISLVSLLVHNASDYEYIYSLSDEIDKVLDLKIKESMNFQPNRDNKHSKGIITRIF